MVPEKTVHAFLALLPLIAVFIGALALEAEQLLKISYVLILLAFIQTILGVTYYTTKTGFLFTFSVYETKEVNLGVFGTYINRDHFVALLYMILPLALSQFFYRLGNKAIARHYKHHGFSTAHIIILFLSVVSSLFIIVGITLSASRAGIFLGLIAVILSTLIFARHVGGKRSTSLASTLAIVSIGVASSIGIIPVLNRFIALDPFEDGRWGYFQVALEGIKQFFPLGTGPSTFQELYRTIQPYDQLQFLNHVHNDYLELVFETGVIGIVFVALFFMVYIQSWMNLRKFTWDEIRFLKTAAGISITLLLLHALVDFNFHTPANALIFSFLLAVFLKRKEP